MKFLSAASAAASCLVAVSASAQDTPFDRNYGQFVPALAVEHNGQPTLAALFWAGPVASAPVNPVNPAALTAEECLAAVGYFTGTIRFLDFAGQAEMGEHAGCLWQEHQGQIRIFGLLSEGAGAAPSATWRGVAETGFAHADTFMTISGGETEALRRVFVVEGPGAAPSVRFVAGGEPTEMTMLGGGSIAMVAIAPTSVLMYYPTPSGGFVWWMSSSTSHELFWQE